MKTKIIPFCTVQEEIKITSITVFVNPYSEPDEEEEEKAKEEKKTEDEDYVSFLTHLYQIINFFFPIFSFLLQCKLIVVFFFFVSG